MTHNPAFLTSESLVSKFVVRHDELATILRVIEENTAPVNQHLVIIAPRGRGKTMLVRRVAIELQRSSALAERWFPVVFGEESYNVTTIGELWLEALLHLADATDDSRWRDTFETLRAESDEHRLSESALACLLDFADEHGVRLCLVVENLDTILESQIDAGADWEIRRVLLEEPRIMLLGTAVHRFEGLDKPDQAFFDLFRRIDLPSLDDIECLTLWKAITGADIGLARAAAIRVLCGGSPRLLTMLAQFADGEDLRGLLDDLSGLIDRHTDYFKHNIEALSRDQRRVFVALAELWRPSLAREVAEVARLPVNQTSAQLRRLETAGRVEIVSTRGRSHLYQVSERLYNIYFLMRRRGGPEARVRALLDFIQQFYEPDRVPDVLARVAGEACQLKEGQRVDHLWLVGEVVRSWEGQPDKQASLIIRLPREFLHLPQLPRSLRDSMRRPDVVVHLIGSSPDGQWGEYAEELIKSEYGRIFDDDYVPSSSVVQIARQVVNVAPLCCIPILCRAGEPHHAIRHVPTEESRVSFSHMLVLLSSCARISETDRNVLLQQAIRQAPNDPLVLAMIGAYDVSISERDMVGMSRLRTAWKMNPDEPLAWLSIISGLYSSGAPTDAAIAAAQAVERWPTRPVFWRMRHKLSFEQGTVDDDLEIASAWLTAIPDSDEALNALALSRLNVGDTAEAVRLVAILVSKIPGDAAYQSNYAWALWQDGRFEDAHVAARSAVNLRPDAALAWRVLAHAALARDRAAVVDLLSESPQGESAVEVADVLWRATPDELLGWAGEWIEQMMSSSDSIGVRFRMARLAGRAGLLPIVQSLLSPLFSDSELVLGSLVAATGDAMSLAACGRPDLALSLIRQGGVSNLLEPVDVALAQLAGEPFEAPIEVREVAEHVRTRIELLAETGDPWRTDPSTLPVVRPG